MDQCVHLALARADLVVLVQAVLVVRVLVVQVAVSVAHALVADVLADLPEEPEELVEPSAVPEDTEEMADDTSWVMSC